MRIPPHGIGSARLAKLMAIPAVALLVAACTNAEQNTNATAVGDPTGFGPDIATAEGALSASLYLPIFIVATVIFFLVEGLLLYMAIRFRKRSSGDDLPEQTHGNNRLEFIWTAIPALIVTIMFIGSAVVLADIQDTSDDPDVVVHVVAQQFGWTFAYQELDPETDQYVDTGAMAYGRTSLPSTTDPAPEGLDLILPVGEPILFKVEARDVIHSFYVPAFFFKRDAVPGRLNEFELTIEQPGTYGGQCAEFCGLLHSQMFFSIRAVERAEYDDWMSQQLSPPASGGQPGDQPPDGAGQPGDQPPDGGGQPGDQPPDGGAPPGDEGATPPDGGASPGDGPPQGPAILEIATTADKPIAFTTADLEAKAGQLTKLHYVNDAKVPHNVAIYDGPDASGSELLETETITGPGASTESEFTAPDEPGEYFYRCEIHPLQMTGTLTVVG